MISVQRRKQACRLVYLIAPLPRSHSCQALDYRVEIVQQFLKPQFVGLMNDDEQQLVVRGRRGELILQLQQIWNPKVGAVIQQSALKNARGAVMAVGRRAERTTDGCRQLSGDVDTVCLLAASVPVRKNSAALPASIFCFASAEKLALSYQLANVLLT